MNATNTPDYTLREALKAAQEENARLREELQEINIECESYAKDVARYVGESLIDHAKLLDREKRLGKINQEIGVNWYTMPSVVLRVIKDSCNLDLPLEGEKRDAGALFASPNFTVWEKKPR